MSKINILNSKIYNRIAAGEVVDRPYSIVKELVENSIDSGAKKITVDIINGGISSISIGDDGVGIEKADLKKALMPHATSKISSIKDLDDISTLGFRGEALASIASVSKILIESKPESQELGGMIYCEGGEIKEISDCGCANGTNVSVKNIFFNTPAREKFLKTPRSEESEISATMARFILGNPNIAFRYTADNEVVYQSFGDGLESAVINVYGHEVINDSFYIDTEKNGFKINGYIGKHHFTKGNRSHQTVFINGRYIVNQTISAAVSNAYSSYLMKHRYPFYILNVTMPTSTVDINVHPNKLDVRFSNNQIVYSTIYSVVSKVLDGSSEAINIVSNEHIMPTDFNKEESVSSTININSPYNVSSIKHKPLENIYFSDVSVKSLPFNDDLLKEKQNSETVNIFAENKAYLEKLEKEKNNLINDAKEQLKIETGKNLTYIGQALNTFLILEDGKDLFLVDQHAAHERILFDKLCNKADNAVIHSQPLLIPFVLNVSNSEYDFIFSNIKELKNIGIDIEEFGKNAFKVNSVPVFLSNINLDNFFNDILNDMFFLKSITVKNVLKEKLASKACKSAIKAGDKLDSSEIDILIDKLKDNLGLQCPHGRPVVIKISRSEIDKWFKRIV